MSHSKILVTGANGYVGNYVALTLAKKYPDVAVVGMSRRGTARDPKKMGE
jgi:nucleoside-diphosphate-sugar epimerase